MAALPHIGGPDPHFGPLQLCRAEHFHRGGSLFGKTEGVTYVFDATGNAGTAPKMRGWLALLRFSVTPVRANLLNATLQHRQGADARRKGLLRWLNASLAVNIAAT